MSFAVRMDWSGSWGRWGRWLHLEDTGADSHCLPRGFGHEARLRSPFPPETSIMTAHRGHDHMETQTNTSTAATRRTEMMMASHSHIDATASAAYVGGGRPKSRRGVRNRLLASSRAWLARLLHGRNHVPVRGPLPSHRTYVLSLSAYAGDATRSARGFLGPAARAETSEAGAERSAG